jgi:TPP-dependent pyruvate/acetoin dehydrogenase alpha subunit
MWKSCDPIPTFTTYLKGIRTLTDEKIKDIEGRITAASTMRSVATNARTRSPRMR